MQAARRPRLPQIDPSRCTGCGRCVAVCEPHVLSLEARRWVKTAVLHEAPRCTGCSLCQRACPFRAIEMTRADGAAVPLPAQSGGAA